MAKHTPLFRTSYNDSREKLDGMFTDHVCCIPDDETIDSMRAAGLTVYVHGKKTSGKILKAQLKDTAACPIGKKECPYFLVLPTD